MAQLAAQAKMNYVPTPNEYASAIAGAFSYTGNHTYRIFDPFIGAGEIMDAINKASGDRFDVWGVEIEGSRIEEAQARFGIDQIVRSDILDMTISEGVFDIVYTNPPYDHGASNEERAEVKLMRPTWKPLRMGGWNVIVSYTHLLSRVFVKHIVNNSDVVEMYSAPDTALHNYEYVFIFARKAVEKENDLFETTGVMKRTDKLMEIVKDGNFTPLSDLEAGRYELKAPVSAPVYRFMSRYTSLEDYLAMRKRSGIQKSMKEQNFQEKPLATPYCAPVEQTESQQIAQFFAGTFNNMAIYSDKHGYGIIRSIIRFEKDKIGEVETVETNKKGESVVKKETTNMRAPILRLVVFYEDGHIETYDPKTAPEFISNYGQQLIAYIDRLYPPHYRITLPYDQNPLKQAYFPHIRSQRVRGKYPLLLGQQHFVSAGVNLLERTGRLFINAEMGVGKTGIIIAIWKTMLKRGTFKDFVLYSAPKHTLRNFEQQVKSQVPDADVHILILKDEKDDRHDILREASKAIKRFKAMPDDRLKILAIATDMINSGGGWENASHKYQRWVKKDGERILSFYDVRITGNRSRDRKYIAFLNHRGYEKGLTFFRCPVTHEMLTDEDKKSGELTLMPASKLENETGNKAIQHVIRVGGRAQEIEAGHFLGKQRVCPQYQVTREGSKPYVKLNAPNEWFIQRGTYYKSNPKGPFVNWILNKLNGVVPFYVADEVQHGKNPFSQRGAGMLKLGLASENYVAMTGTGTNGKVSSLYPVLAVLSEHVRKKYPPVPSSLASFIRDYSIMLEYVSENDDERTSSAQTGTKKKRVRTEEAVGITALVINLIGEYMLVMKKTDLNHDMIELKDEYVEIDDSDFVQAYAEEINNVETHEPDDKARGAWALASARATSTIPDVIGVHDYTVEYKWRDYEIDAEYITHVADFKKASGRHFTTNKEDKLVEIVAEHHNQGRGVAIFMDRVKKYDIRDRLAHLIESQTNARCFVLGEETDSLSRMKAINDAYETGRTILIANGTLVETGVDLLKHPTIIMYSPYNSLTSAEQMMMRAWRINQTQPCHNYYFAYGSRQVQELDRLIKKRISQAALNGNMAAFTATVLPENVKITFDGEDLESANLGDIQEMLDVINKRQTNPSIWSYDDGLLEVEWEYKDYERPEAHFESVFVSKPDGNYPPPYFKKEPVKQNKRKKGDDSAVVQIEQYKMF